MAEYVEYLTGKKNLLILHAQTFLQTSENCTCPMTVQKKGFADSV